MHIVNDLYLYARRRLIDAGVSMPELEARELTGKACGIPGKSVIQQSYKYVSEGAPAALEALLGERLSGRPLAYVIGQWDFLDVTLKITDAVLIPRSDTETLALEAIGRLRAAGGAPRVLDLCCGSGCVGIAIGKHCPEARLTFCDISGEAMNVARENSRLLPGLCMFVTADALADPPNALRQFDLIAANPPYVTTAEWEALSPEVRDHEPRLALDGGADGLSFYRSIARRWKRCLAPGGVLLFETGYTQAGQVASMMRAEAFADVSVTKDLSGVDRVVAGVRSPASDPTLQAGI